MNWHYHHNLISGGASCMSIESPLADVLIEHEAKLYIVLELIQLADG